MADELETKKKGRVTMRWAEGSLLKVEAVVYLVLRMLHCACFLT